MDLEVVVVALVCQNAPPFSTFWILHHWILLYEKCGEFFLLILKDSNM